METQDTGLPIYQTQNALIPRAAHNFEFFAEICQQMNGQTYPVDDQMLNYTLVQPVGVCALVSPWNVPFMTATWKVAPCLALGNTAILKMSELSPLTADKLGELALEAGIPAGVLNVVQGYGATVGDALVCHQDVRAISFTGGTATGNRIMQRAGLKNTPWNSVVNPRYLSSTMLISNGLWMRRYFPSSLSMVNVARRVRAFLFKRVSIRHLFNVLLSGPAVYVWGTHKISTLKLAH